jgi:presenilin 1
MVLSALAVVYINNEETLEQGAQQMAEAYQVWNVDDSSSSVGMNIAYSLANSLIMVTFICMMTFVIVLLYKYNCMKCLIGYMMMCSTTLLGFLGGHMYWIAIQIYRLPVDKLSYYLFLWNFAVVGVMAIFGGAGVPKFVTQGYLIATSVIMAWHLDYFDEYTTWSLLFMLALYDLCAVLTPCGPLKALVNLMSRDNAPEMPGLLYEADLPPEARRPGGPRNKNSQASSNPTPPQRVSGDDDSDHRSTDSNQAIEIPLAVARVYNLTVLSIPLRSQEILGGKRNAGAKASRAPLLDGNVDEPMVPDNPTPTQLMADVLVKLPQQGGRIEKLRRNGKTMYLEKDRSGHPKRVLWVDKTGRVFAESSEGKEDSEDRNTIRLGLGDFIFYSVLVAKAAQYSFTTFAACTLVILAGLGGTLVLLSVFHHALPALPISICLGILFYICTRIFIEPWIEEILLKPYYV